jgi:hypothetical protein
MNREVKIANRVMMAATFSQFEQALKQHDWTYNYSDDGRVWRRGEAQAKDIESMAKELVLVDADRTVDLYNKYGREGWSGDWTDVTADKWMNIHRHEAELAAYRKTLEKEIREGGRLFGTPIAGKWSDNGWIGYPPNFTLLVRGKDHSEFTIVLSGTGRGSHLAIRKGTLVAQEKVEGYYSIVGGVKPEEVARTIQKMYKDLVERGVIE